MAIWVPWALGALDHGPRGPRGRLVPNTLNFSLASGRHRYDHYAQLDNE